MIFVTSPSLGMCKGKNLERLISSSFQPLEFGARPLVTVIGAIT